MSETFEDVHSSSSAPPTPDPRRLVFGYAPSVEGERTRHALADLCRTLGDAIGVDIAPMRVASYGALERAVLEERASVGWFPPVILARLELAGRVTAFAQCVRAGVASYHSCVIVHEDSPVERLEDLRAARAVWVDRNSAAGYIFPRLLLGASGIDPVEAFREEHFVQSHAEVVRAIVARSAEVGATFASVQGDSRIVRGGWTDPDGTNPRPIKVIARFGPIPNDSMAASLALPVETREALARAALDVGNAPSLRGALRHLFGADALGPVSDATYAELRVLVARSIASGSVPPPE